MKTRLFRIVIHMPVGWLFVGAAFIHWSVVLTAAFMFWFYERNEDRHIKDEAWKDVAGALWGIAEAVIFLLWVQYYS